jgi:hypothetical protein
VPSRERKRAARRKRKERGAERMRSAYARAEERDEAARAALEPLHEGERPLVVTVSAAISAAVALTTITAWLAEVEVDGERPAFIQSFAPALLFGVMAWGLWRARYWAVLGFQTLLLFALFASAWGLATQAGSVWAIAITLVLLAGAGALFWFMVKAMARIQMPHRLPRD